MRLLSTALVFVLLAGCASSSSDATPTSDASALPSGGEREERELGRTNGGAPLPAEYAFTVTVPAGGALEVGYRLTVETLAIGDYGLEGGDCDQVDKIVEAAPNLFAGIQLTYTGACANLPEGDHTFRFFHDGPLISFEAVVSGNVLV
ncbi:MAG: hypothetical protein AABX89_05955 [Candidatus Thermoplasmatota archaeon]